MDSQSILDSVKIALGGNLHDEENHFDVEIMLHINSVFNILHQLGVGPDTSYEITSRDNVWGEFIQDSRLGLVKSYMYLKVRMMFDPPQSSNLANVYNEQIAEFEWRLNVSADIKEETT